MADINKVSSDLSGRMDVLEQTLAKQNGELRKGVDGVNQKIDASNAAMQATLKNLKMYTDDTSSRLKNHRRLIDDINNKIPPRATARLDEVEKRTSGLSYNPANNTTKIGGTLLLSNPISGSNAALNFPYVKDLKLKYGTNNAQVTPAFLA